MAHTVLLPLAMPMRCLVGSLSLGLVLLLSFGGVAAAASSPMKLGTVRATRDAMRIARMLQRTDAPVSQLFRDGDVLAERGRNQTVIITEGKNSTTARIFRNAPLRHTRTSIFRKGTEWEEWRAGQDGKMIRSGISNVRKDYGHLAVLSPVASPN